MFSDGIAVARWFGSIAARGMTGRLNSETASTNVKHGEIGHLSKRGSGSSNTEPDAFTTDFPSTAPPAQPDHGSQPSPLFRMPRSNLDTLLYVIYLIDMSSNTFAVGAPQRRFGSWNSVFRTKPRPKSEGKTEA